MPSVCNIYHAASKVAGIAANKTTIFISAAFFWLYFHQPVSLYWAIHVSLICLELFCVEYTNKNWNVTIHKKVLSEWIMFDQFSLWIFQEVTHIPKTGIQILLFDSQKYIIFGQWTWDQTYDDSHGPICAYPAYVHATKKWNNFN